MTFGTFGDAAAELRRYLCASASEIKRKENRESRMNSRVCRAL